ncbi:MAG: hypothetical protein KC877_00055 [Candidatus Kaiserbacteria bacterium]|nr:hypothetical protein [Candidatus Kaiserbacteria bacterium]MCB9816622.1 hypothetical protein [Candidatus Nomurabacteria bacterium]
MNKKLLIAIGAFVFIIVISFSLIKDQTEVSPVIQTDISPGTDIDERASEIVGYVSNAKNLAYTIEGQQLQLQNGYAESAVAPDSAIKIITRYFGNELLTDLDGDGDDDVALIITQESGGTGTFYYAAAALQTPEGYVGSDAYYLGDRIAPQPTTASPNSAQPQVVVFNFADRAPGEPMTTPPSIGKSVYLEINPQTNTWVVVE